MLSALFVREDSAYKDRLFFDAYDINRDALGFNGSGPVVCHPPCRSWGRLSHMANPREGEKALAPWSINLVRKVGGIVEHPIGSKLWKTTELPRCKEVDAFGGYFVDLDQYDFGHVAHKATRLYICGIPKESLPALPEKDFSIHTCPKGKTRSICGNVKGTTRCTQYQREYTPEKLLDWIEDVLTLIQRQAKIEVLREALEHIKTHQMISAGDMAPMSAIYQMATKALEATK